MPKEADSKLSLKKQRAVIKGLCTRIKHYVEALTDVSTPIAIAQLRGRLRKLEGCWSDYQAVQGQLEIIDETELDDRLEFEEALFTLSAQIEVLLGPSTQASVVSIPSNSRSSAKLPKIKTPTFSGKYDDWYPFYNVFQSVIHDNSELNNLEKLQYLRTSLTGEAANIVESLELKAENYEVAWSLLRTRYDNRRVIVRGHVEAIMTFPPMKRNNHSELRQIIDGFTRHLQALQALKLPVEHWDEIMIYVLCSKLDQAITREWENSLPETESPAFKDLIEFITRRCRSLAITTKSSGASPKGDATRSGHNSKQQNSCIATVKPKCVFCSADHLIYYCKKFEALPVPQRLAEARNRKLCLNCLRQASHNPNKCTSGKCKSCQGKHNTLLHDNANSSQASIQSDDGSNSKSSDTSTGTVTLASGLVGSNRSMLSTAMVYVPDIRGSLRPCRVFLDAGSQINVISRKFLNTLGIETRPLNVSIAGMYGMSATSTQAARIILRSRVNDFATIVDCVVAEGKITNKLPAFTFKRSKIELPKNITLADPHFNVSADIDVLLGVDYVLALNCVGQIPASGKHPLLQKTKLGWIFAGSLGGIPRISSKAISLQAIVTNEELHAQLKQFWIMDDIYDQSDNYTAEERLCEQHFLSNISQNAEGRYVVKLPIKEDVIAQLGDSRGTAFKRLVNLEARFKRDSVLKERYTQFLDEYLSLGHMHLVEPSDSESFSFYLPHHGVFKRTSQSAKIRVVFDASCKSTSGVSLNDVLRVGPVVQSDLADILMRFRNCRYVFSADIIKMYRQILVDPAHTSLQRILWRSDPSSKVNTYELNTVTYGTSSASYLATRCLNHLADRYASKFPLGSAHIKRNFYVDDLLTGADTLSEIKQIRNEVITLLQLGKFELSKWASNCPQLLKDLRQREDAPIIVENEAQSSILGIRWNQSKDMLCFSCNLDSPGNAITKRTILAEVSRLFDPLGLLGPVIVVAKLLIQELWQSGYHWDESIPQDVHYRWLKFRSQLNDLNQLQVPRCVKLNYGPQRVQIHGFCDASQRAYGACIYIRSHIEPERYHSELLCSKSRVAPIKAVSLPRLELCGAVLLARLMHKVSGALSIERHQIFLWSDSTVALNWIASSSRRWSVFVANRVGEIQRLTDVKAWRHVISADNPADILSRGSHPSDLANSFMWWHGPTFLQNEDEQWPGSTFTQLGDDIPEQRPITVAVAVSTPCIISETLSRCSKLYKACRVIAYCLRLLKKYRSDALTLIVSPSETDHALDIICKSVQRQAFPSEYKLLGEGGTVSSTSGLLSLSPFLDEKGLMRVGGRLRNSALQFNTRHPLLLPRKHDLTRLVIEHEHVRNMHAGVQATMASVRERFWPLALRSSARKIVQGCVICFKAKPRQSEATMGSLPASRVTVSRPFSHCGVDYAGPIILREGKRRNARNHKAYVAIFVCFATKAIHIELVSDLTTDAFLGTFKRFISRRGRPSNMYSDNGTTFVGAQKQLEEMRNFYLNQQTQLSIEQFLSHQGVAWTFIPPNAPHFGGLWEAAVKSAKMHMTRIVGRAHLTFEEMSTVLCEIEAILNSRPITPLSDDPNDMSYLSPGHFLVGTTLNGLPQPNLIDISENRLVRWQRVEQIRQHFWKRWSTEYLHSLQQRNKWRSNQGPQLEPGQLVLIKQQNIAPLHWALGRVQETHPGADNIVRTATIRTSKGSLMRPLSKLAILPTSA